MVKRHLCHCGYGSTKIDRKTLLYLLLRKDQTKMPSSQDRVIAEQAASYICVSTPKRIAVPAPISPANTIMDPAFLDARNMPASISIPVIGELNIMEPQRFH